MSINGLIPAPTKSSDGKGDGVSASTTERHVPGASTVLRTVSQLFLPAVPGMESGFAQAEKALYH